MTPASRSLSAAIGSALRRCAMTDADIGNTTGALLTIRTTFPEPGVSIVAKKGLLAEFKNKVGWAKCGL